MRNLAFALLASAGAIGAGCAHQTPRELIDARAIVHRAEAGPARQLAPVQLDNARNALAQAETMNQRASVAATRDFAYVATRRAQIAEAQAALVTAQREKANAEKQRAEVEARAASAAQQTAQATQKEQKAEHELATERHEREQLAQELNRIANVQQEGRGTVVTLPGSVVFSVGKAELRPMAQQRLNQVVNALKQLPKSEDFTVEGYTDSTGTATLNNALSQQRAEAVRDYLIAHGIDGDRIRAIGMGEQNPVDDNSTSEGRAANRRVEIVISRPVG
jgi:outer membrane protein OmpA-like peptidoglycan-associated protein